MIIKKSETMTENYKIILDEFRFRSFIDWLPDLKESEIYYFCLFARSKYCSGVKSIKSDRQQVKRGTSKKQYLFDKIKQLECEIGSYKQGTNPIPQEAIALYINPNPRCFLKASINGTKKLLELVTKPYSGYNPHQEILSEIQKAKSRTVFFDIDFDYKFSEFDKKLLNGKINTDAINLLHTHSGFHFLVEIDKIAPEFSKTWYNSLTKLPGVDHTGDSLIPIPGTYQGGFCPELTNLIEPD